MKSENSNKNEVFRMVLKIKEEVYIFTQPLRSGRI